MQNSSVTGAGLMQGRFESHVQLIEIEEADRFVDAIHWRRISFEQRLFDHIGSDGRHPRTDHCIDVDEELVLQFSAGWDQEADAHSRHSVDDQVTFVWNTFVVVQEYSGKARFTRVIMNVHRSSQISVKVDSNQSYCVLTTTSLHIVLIIHLLW